MRRILAPLIAASVLTLLAVATPFAVPTGAAPKAPARVVDGSCQPLGYPDGQHARVQVDRTVVYVGGPLEVSGDVYCPNENVDITIAGQSVGTGHTDDQGHFDPRRVTAPGPPGTKELCGIGASGKPFDQDCLDITVRANGGPNNHGGGTAFTGVQIALLGLLALMLVVGGVVVTTLGRNRRPERA